MVKWAAPFSLFPEVAFRRLFEQVRRPVPDLAEIVTAYTNGDVTLRSNRRIDGYHEAADLSGFQGVWVGDFVVHGLDILRGSVGVSDSAGAISSVCIVCRPRRSVDARFFAYAMRAQAFSGFPRAMARGVREGGADFRRWDTLAELPLPSPPTPVQRAIADFLDAETARIDALIAGKRRLGGLAEERWEATVRAVGARWPRVPLRRLWTITDCKHRTPDYVDVGFPVVSPGDVAPGRLDLSRCHRFVDRDDLADLTEGGRTPRRGDIVYSRNASIGIAAYVDTDQLFSMGQDVCLVRSRTVDARWTTFMLNSVGVDQLAEMKIGSTFDRVNIAQLRDLEIPVPPANRQEAETQYLTEYRRRVEGLVDKLDTQIALLQEHRQALITAAVTGEIDIPGAAA